MQSLFASGFNNYWEFPLNQMALKPLLLGLSMLRDGVIKGSCCDYQGFVLRTTSVVLPRKVSPKSKKGGWWLWERWHVLCDPWRTGRNMLWKSTFILGISDFHPCSLWVSWELRFRNCYFKDQRLVTRYYLSRKFYCNYLPLPLNLWKHQHILIVQ